MNERTVVLQFQVLEFPSRQPRHSRVLIRGLPPGPTSSPDVGDVRGARACGEARNQQSRVRSRNLERMLLSRRRRAGISTEGEALQFELFVEHPPELLLFLGHRPAPESAALSNNLSPVLHLLR